MENDTIKTILAHTSIRKFDPDFTIPKEQIDLIVKAGQRASTSSLMQMYTLIEIPKEDRQGLTTICGTQQFIKDASYFGVLFLDFYRLQRMVELSGGQYKKKYNALELSMGTLDAGLFSQNIALAAEALGYGICFCGACGDFGQEIVRQLQIPKKVVPLTGIAIGLALEKPKPTPRLSLDLIHHHGKYKMYTNTELTEAIEQVSKGLSEKVGKERDWKKSLRVKFDSGSWASTRDFKRQLIIDTQLKND